MHTGSGIFSGGRALAHSWAPSDPHQEILLVASLPKAPPQQPNRVNGVHRDWGNAPISLDPPQWEVLSLPPGVHEGSLTLQATNKKFSCSFSWRTADSSAATQHYAAVAIDGSFWDGALPSRACIFYAIPPASLNDSMRTWKPWFMGGTPLYRTQLDESTVDLNASALFSELQIIGSFADGDIVLPMLAAAGGNPAGEALVISANGRGMQLAAESKVTQAMLYLNTHEPHEIFSATGSSIQGV